MTNWWERDDAPQFENNDLPQTCFFQDGETCLRNTRGEGSIRKDFRHPNLLVVCRLNSCPEAGNTDGQKMICPKDYVNPRNINPINHLRRKVELAAKIAMIGPTSK